MLTQNQAKQAGVIAAQIDMLNASIAAAQEAVAANVQLTSHSAVAYNAGTVLPLSCSYPLSVADSESVLNALLQVYQSNLAALNSQLAGM